MKNSLCIGRQCCNNRNIFPKREFFYSIPVKIPQITGAYSSWKESFEHEEKKVIEKLNSIVRGELKKIQQVEANS